MKLGHIGSQGLLRKITTWLTSATPYSGPPIWRRYNLFDHYRTREFEKTLQDKIRRATQYPSFANISLVTVYKLQFAQFDKLKNKQNIDSLQNKTNHVLGYTDLTLLEITLSHNVLSDV